MLMVSVKDKMSSLFLVTILLFTETLLIDALQTVELMRFNSKIIPSLVEGWDHRELQGHAQSTQFPPGKINIFDANSSFFEDAQNATADVFYQLPPGIPSPKPSIDFPIPVKWPEPALPFKSQAAKTSSENPDPIKIISHKPVESITQPLEPVKPQPINIIPENQGDFVGPLESEPGKPQPINIIPENPGDLVGSLESELGKINDTIAATTQWPSDTMVPVKSEPSIDP
jgi:hypothetical protein